MNERRWRAATAALFAALLLLVVPFPAAAQMPPLEDFGQKRSNPEEAPAAPLGQVMPLDPTIIVGKLDNGLRYYIRENSFPAQRAELRLVVNAGSLLEDDDQRGIAHFVEHMAFNGTENFEKQELVKALESFGMRFGADINAYTSFDETVYMLRIPTDADEIVTTAFQVLEDWAHGVRFDAEEIEKERGVVIEEWRLGLGAGSRIRDQQFPILFRGSRYAERLPIGTFESLQSFEPEAARRFYSDWYRPELMAVIAVGDFDKQDVERRIREHFAEIPMPEGARPRPLFEIPEHEETLFAITTDAEATGSSVAVFHKLPIREQGRIGTYRQSIVENLYNSMLNRRLVELSQQPDPPFLGASSDQGIFVPTREVYVLGAAVPDGGVEEGLEALFRETARIRQHGFTETELQREKSQLLRAFERIYTERDLQNSNLFVEEFQRAFLEGESVPGIPYEWALYQRFVEEISLEEVNAAGEQWLSQTDRVILVTAPQRLAATLPTEEELLAVLNRVSDREVRAYVDTVTDAPLLSSRPDAGSIIEEERIEELDLTEWTLSNGARVVVKPTDFREEQVLFRAFSPGGTSLASDEDYIAAISATQVISGSGFGRFSAREITNMLADKVVEADPTIGTLEEGFRGGASPRDLATLFELVYLKFTQPRAERGVFEIMTEQMKARLANTNVTPEAAWRERLQRLLTQDHFRRRPITPDVIDEMDLRASYDFYRDRFADAGDFTFVFVGNVDLERMRPLVERYLASLPSTGRQESWRDEGIDPPTGVIHEVVRRGVEPKSLTALVLTGEPPEEQPHPRALQAASIILQTRLREVMREDLGGTYSVSVDAEQDEVPDREYSVSIVFGSDPHRVAELVDVVFAEIEKLKAGVTQQEVDNVKAQLRRQHELAVKENGYWLSRLVSAYRDEEDPREILEYLDTLEELEPEHVRAVAQRYFDESNHVRVSLLPEEGAARR